MVETRLLSASVKMEFDGPSGKRKTEGRGFPNPNTRLVRIVMYVGGADRQGGKTKTNWRHIDRGIDVGLVARRGSSMIRARKEGECNLLGEQRYVVVTEPDRLVIRRHRKTKCGGVPGIGP